MTAAVVLAALAAALAVPGLAELATSMRAGTARSTRDDANRPVVRRARRLWRPLADAIGAGTASAPVARRLALAGLAPAIRVADLVAARCASASVALAVAAPLSGSLPARPATALVLLSPLAGLALPDALIGRRIAARRRAMAAELPELLDLVAVAVGAGRPGLRALREVAARRPGPLAQELGAAVSRIELGMPRAQAWEGLRDRCPALEVPALVAALERSHRLGAPLAPVLAALAAQGRALRTQQLGEQAARAAPKIQLVIALLLVPSVLLLVGAAIVAGLR